MKNKINLKHGKAAIILSVLAGVGVIFTGVMSAKGAIAAQKRKEEAQCEKTDELTMKEVIIAEAPAYIPAAIIGLCTIVCIFGSSALNRKQQAILISAYALLDQSFKEYREKVNSVCGPGTDEFISESLDRENQDVENGQPPWDEPRTFYMKQYGKFFDRTMEEVMAAEYHANRNFILNGEVTFNEFLDFLGLDHIENGDMIGWNAYSCNDWYGCCYEWIDFINEETMMDDMMVTSIEMPFEPHPLNKGPWNE